MFHGGMRLLQKVLDDRAMVQSSSTGFGFLYYPQSQNKGLGVFVTCYSWNQLNNGGLCGFH